MCKGELSSKSWRREDVESGVKLRSLRRPFHPDVQFLRIYNPGEKSTETRSSQAMTADSRRFYFTELTVPLVYIFVAFHVLANVADATSVAGYRAHKEL
jgi:hypothetical protein